MKIFSIAYYTIVKNFRDRKSISLTLFFPILLILILGTALNSAYSPRTLDKINVAYVNVDNAAISKQFDAFLNKNNIKALLNITKSETYESGIKLMTDSKVQILIYIKSNFSEDISKGKKAVIEVYESKSKGLSASVVKSIVESFVNGSNTMEAVYKMGTGAGANNQRFIESKSITDLPITTKGNIPRAIDYYAVTMLAMTLMYGTLFASYAMAEDKLEKTYIRIKSSPIKAYINYLGKTLGTIVTLMLEVIILIIFTKYAYHVNWGSNIPLILFLASLFSIFVTGLGIMAYAVTNNARIAGTLLNVLTVSLTFVSGGYSKINASGSMFDKLVFFAPNKMFQTAMFNTIYGGSINQTQTCIIGLIVATMIVFLIAVSFGRRVLD